MTNTTSIDIDLERFMIAWGSTRCYVEKDFIVYKTAVSYGKRAAYNAEILLRDLGLDGKLEAIATDLPANDSFRIQIKKK